MYMAKTRVLKNIPVVFVMLFHIGKLAKYAHHGKNHAWAPLKLSYSVFARKGSAYNALFKMSRSKVSSEIQL